ncbi:octanoyltransferase [Terrilactibacillus sp. BCM23-1]|uniref:Octanoyl-[GcvH]:protein N-octanoyltransferase n=1 Tax=Terrilactibacillus tamarindi TaxID=2599694 RepID=A0A6N8CLU2_9BACI|nr:lipoate--protein ligase family protein [Terrilactibacillus tamarindi]MTT30949.1 octanoyltransferase [Terrilactibacillus tamarindi]
MTSLLYQPTWRWIDQSTLGPSFNGMQSFAMDDTLCHSVGSGESAPVIRTWVHHQTVILGIQDMRLPHLQDGIHAIQQQGYHCVTRNSGGLAVVLDEGVLNISLIFSEQTRSLSIDESFEAMVDFIKMCLEPIHVSFEAKEIVGSYCPGRYDLSVNGKKFAGISQRRIRKGVAVQIYLCLTGSGSKRAELIKSFYDRGLRGEQTKFVYPKIVPEKMASLEEISGSSLTVQSFIVTLLQVIQQFGEISSPLLSSSEQNLFRGYYQRIRERNDPLNKMTRR